MTGLMKSRGVQWVARTASLGVIKNVYRIKKPLEKRACEIDGVDVNDNIKFYVLEITYHCKGLICLGSQSLAHASCLL
jgi:endonuclease V-like protein UPF0215 family